MGLFDHTGLMAELNQSLGAFRQAQPEAMAGFGALARAAITDGVLSEVALPAYLIQLRLGLRQ